MRDLIEMTSCQSSMMDMIHRLNKVLLLHLLITSAKGKSEMCTAKLTRSLTSLKTENVMSLGIWMSTLSMVTVE